MILITRHRPRKSIPNQPPKEQMEKAFITSGAWLGYCTGKSEQARFYKRDEAECPEICSRANQGCGPKCTLRGGVPDLFGGALLTVP